MGFVNKLIVCLFLSSAAAFSNDLLVKEVKFATVGWDALAEPFGISDLEPSPEGPVADIVDDLYRVVCKVRIGPNTHTLSFGLINDPTTPQGLWERSDIEKFHVVMGYGKSQGAGRWEWDNGTYKFDFDNAKSEATMTLTGVGAGGSGKCAGKL